MTRGETLAEHIQRLDTRQLRRDVFLFFLLPSAGLILIFLIPQSEQFLEYRARNPTVVGIIGSNLAHRNVSHLAGNVIGYWVLGGTALLLLTQAGVAHLYRYAFVVYLLVLPFFASWTILSIFSDRPDIIARFASVGFSQTVGAVTGLLPIAIAYYQSTVTDGDYALEISLGLFSLGFAVAFYSLGQVSGVVIILATVGVVSLCYIGYDLVTALTTVGDPRLVGLVGAVALFLIGVQSLFPPAAPPGIYGHMAGYVWGYVLPIAGIAGTILYRAVRPYVFDDSD